LLTFLLLTEADSLSENSIVVDQDSSRKNTEGNGVNSPLSEDIAKTSANAGNSKDRSASIGAGYEKGDHS
jgi:hypothetical protein